ncbi:GntR family transcriptional regulator [Oceanobacillus sojae]|uniref:GntR family transcriptional regulator n=1 Tax=Oceanobacillus sojae TaxID=582851 RepID=UPI003628BB93
MKNNPDLNKEFVPLYHQLKETIREEIDSGNWRPNDKIPSEHQFMGKYQVSRNTVQKAVDDLVHEGLIYRQQGRGTFVAQPKVEQSLTSFYIFSKVMKDKGLNPYDIILDIDEVTPKKSVAKQLQIDTEEKVIQLVRVRCANNEPLIFETTFLPKKIVPHLTKEDVEKNTLFTFMEQKYNISVVSSKEVFEPVLIRDYESKHLDVKPGMPGLLLDRVDYDLDKRPVSYLRSIVRGDRCRFYTELIK